MGGLWSFARKLPSRAARSSYGAVIGGHPQDLDS
jgi:hypothetical protein